ncbi:unnamed protein product [Mytilus coruscus]|uniref:Uncharacterized protein n=1 Tax=Mytilus coruscus TaxID=42192 RepID=A0A6J8DY64_MYTCO|nr:unnamed protein product [Mytilus coruscus]
MDASNMYIPDAVKWLRFYKDNVHNRQHKRKNQKGGSLVNGRQSEIAPIEVKRNSGIQMDMSKMPVKIVSPSIQGKVFTSTSGFYPYKAYMQSLLRYGSDAKDSQLTTQLWRKDTPFHLDDTDFTNGDNINGTVRMTYIAKSMTLDLEGPILHDLFDLRRYLLHQIGVSIRFHQSNPEFCLLSNEVKTYKR